VIRRMWGCRGHATAAQFSHFPRRGFPNANRESEQNREKKRVAGMRRSKSNKSIMHIAAIPPATPANAGAAPGDSQRAPRLSRSINRNANHANQCGPHDSRFREQLEIIVMRMIEVQFRPGRELVARKISGVAPKTGAHDWKITEQRKPTLPSRDSIENCVVPGD